MYVGKKTHKQCNVDCITLGVIFNIGPATCHQFALLAWENANCSVVLYLLVNYFSLDIWLDFVDNEALKTCAGNIANLGLISVNPYVLC